MTRTILSSCLLFTVACNGALPGRPVCTSTAQCPAGHACFEGDCRELCNRSDQCGPGEVCGDGLCELGSDSSAPPRIDAIASDGVDECPATPGGQCLERSIIVAGAGLAQAEFALQPTGEGSPIPLATTGRVIDGQVQLLLPDVAPGGYLLTAMNQAGSAEATLTLLQGPRGPQGPPGPAGTGEAGALPTSDELVGLVNAASVQLTADVLPLGDRADQVAPGDHVHDAADLVSGMIDAARLPIGGGAGQVAAGNHTHSGYAPASHDHDGRYLQAAQLDNHGSYSVTSFGQGAMSIAMTSSASSICMLTEVKVTDVDGGSEEAGCSITDVAGSWKLTASTASGDDNDARCAARCLAW